MFQIFGQNTCPVGYQCHMGQCEPDFGKNTINAMYFQQFFLIIFFYSYDAVILAWVLQELTKNNVRIDDCKILCMQEIC